jgi:hypothetical protein
MRLTLVALSFFITAQVFPQKREKFVSLAVTNQHSAFPFSTFKNLFAKEFNPGLEVGYGFNRKTRPRHDWYQAFKAGYFYHRFVQHAVPLYTQIGYRYKLQQLRFTAALGAGYLHSIPATAVLELQMDGTYKNAKGIGRGQALILLSTGAEYMLSKSNTAPTVFLHYRQQLQTPFINSYVPLLPYNGLALGLSFSIKK